GRVVILLRLSIPTALIVIRLSLEISIRKARICRRRDAANRPALDRDHADAPNSLAGLLRISIHGSPRPLFPNSRRPRMFSPSDDWPPPSVPEPGSVVPADL